MRVILLYVGVLLSFGLFISGCSDFNNDSESGVNEVTSIDASDVGVSLIGLQTTDENNNIITFYISDQYTENNVTVVEGIDNGSPSSYEIISNEFISVEVPTDISLIYFSIEPTVAFDTLMIFNKADNTMEIIPFIVNENNIVEFQSKPVDGYIEFALMKSKEL